MPNYRLEEIIFITDFEQINGAKITIKADFDDIILPHIQHLWSIVVLDSSATEKELEGGDGDADVCLVVLLQPSHFLRRLVIKVNLAQTRANRFRALTHHFQLDEVLFTLPFVTPSC